MPCPFCPPAKQCRQGFRICLSHLIYKVWPCLIHTCQAILLKATAQHVRWETACELPARIHLLPATTRSSAKVVIRRITVSDAGGQCETKCRLSWMRKRVVAANYKKDNPLHCRNSSSDISDYRSRAGTWHGMYELTHSMAGELHGRSMLCVNQPLVTM